MAIHSLLTVFMIAAAGDMLVRLPWLRSVWHAGTTELTNPHKSVTVGVLDKCGEFQPNVEAASTILGKK